MVAATLAHLEVISSIRTRLCLVVEGHRSLRTRAVLMLFQISSSSRRSSRNISSLLNRCIKSNKYRIMARIQPATRRWAIETSFKERCSDLIRTLLTSDSHILLLNPKHTTSIRWQMLRWLCSSQV